MNRTVTAHPHAIAARAGVSKRTLYKHYASKEALVAAYLARRAVVATDRYRDQGPPGNPYAQILSVYDVFERRFADPAFRGCPFVNAVSELGGDEPAHEPRGRIAVLRRRLARAGGRRTSPTRPARLLQVATRCPPPPPHRAPRPSSTSAATRAKAHCTSCSARS